MTKIAYRYVSTEINRMDVNWVYILYVYDLKKSKITNLLQYTKEFNDYLMIDFMSLLKHWSAIILL